MSTSTTVTDPRAGVKARRRVVGHVLPAFFGRYVLLERLGAGGMGVVYRAVPLRGGPDVALKVLTSHYDYPDTRARFEREIVALATVEHPAIVRVLDWGEVRGQPFFTMERVPGINARELIEREGAQPVERVLRIFERLLDAVDAAHAAGLVHRDIKVGNVMIAPDTFEPTLLDFGLVLEPGRRGERITLDDSMLGTPGYLAPEGMISARSIGVPADIYGLALTAVHLLHGRPVFRPGDLASPELHLAAKSKAFARISGVPPKLRDALWRALGYYPLNRPTLDELHAAVPS